MIDASSKLARNVAMVGIFGAALCTTVMNVKFGMSLGSDDTEKIVYAIFGVCLDIAKFFGLAYVANALFKKHYFKASCAALVWIVAVVYSLFAATGFAAMTRAHVTAERSYHADQAKLASSTYSRLAGELETMKSNQRYTSTAGCTVPQEKMHKDSVAFCTQYWEKTVALTEAQKVLPKGVVHDSDPQMTFFSEFFGVDKKRMIAWWAFGLAIVAEIVASIGTYAFSSSRMVSSPKLPSNAPAQMVEGEVPRKRGRPKGSRNKPKLVVVN